VGCAVNAAILRLGSLSEADRETGMSGLGEGGLG